MHKQLRKNALFASLQTVVSAAVLFFSYGFAYRILGSEELGRWALTTGLSGLVLLGQLGLPGALTRYLPRISHDPKDLQGVADLIWTFVCFGLAAASVLAALIFVFGKSAWVINYFPVLEQLNDDLLGISLLCQVSLCLTSLVFAAIDGMHQAEIRSKIVMLGLIIYAVLLPPFLLYFKIYGFAYATLVQQAINSVFGIYFIKKILFKGSGSGMPKFNLFYLKNTFSFSIQTTGIAILNVLTDLVVKLMVASHSGFSFLAIYDLAWRFCLQARNILASASGVLVPYFSAFQVKHGRLRFFQLNIIGRSYFEIASLLFFAIGWTSPLISLLWLGRLEDDFVEVVFVISAAWIINMSSLVIYMANIASGMLGRNLLFHCLNFLVNVFAFVLVHYYSSLESFFWLVPSFSLALSSFYLMFCGGGKFTISNFFVFKWSTLKGFFINFSISVVGYFSLCEIIDGGGWFAAGCVGLSGGLLAIIGYNDRLFNKILKQFATRDSG